MFDCMRQTNREEEKKLGINVLHQCAIEAMNQEQLANKLLAGRRRFYSIALVIFVRICFTNVFFSSIAICMRLFRVLWRMVFRE